ncbi:hypothetical protein GCM10010172_57420 [Paractinoplanes ferrugineus]|uniref:Uncharacterized protein n=1 Tax=Paractinoplanes ferrugineus TaxID=113564 RepID=A0A919MCI5_9ACTN|nr:hypothetical protein [Actinoplanes ferrugineus]GIE10788.1 hypothetical protein Afe05nite_26280 [Actinoplanes ferrugineus]
MHVRLSMWARAQRRRWQVVLAAVGLLSLGVGAGGVLADANSPEPVPLTLAPPWEPVVPSPGGPVTLPPPDALRPPSAPATIEVVAPTTPARTAAASPAPVQPLLTVLAGQIPAEVDLGREGVKDWVHWGLSTASSVDRKWGVTAAIKDLGSPTARGRYDNNPQVYRWSAGDPTWAWDDTPTGVYVCGADTGFVLQLPAGPATRTLRLYAGVWMAEGQLTATLDGAAAVSRTLVNTQALSTTRFEIKFRAAAGSRLNLSWNATEVYHPTCGNVDIQAATLS